MWAGVDSFWEQENPEARKYNLISIISVSLFYKIIKYFGKNGTHNGLRVASRPTRKGRLGVENV